VSLSKVMIAGVGALSLALAACGGSSAGQQPSAAPSAGPAGAAVKVAFITKFPVAFFTAMEDAAKSYTAQNSGIEVSYFSCKTPSDVACQTAQIEDAVARKFQAIVITPMGPEVVPAMTAAADKGLKVVLDVHGKPRHSVRGIVVHRKHLSVAGEAGNVVKVYELKTGRLVPRIRGGRSSRNPCICFCMATRSTSALPAPAASSPTTCRRKLRAASSRRG